MNAIGVDYGRTVTVIGLRESSGLAARVRSVGDGFRDLVPHAVAGGDRWGSQALQSPTEPARASAPGAASGARSAQDAPALRAGGPSAARDPEPWTTLPDAGAFWQGLYRRVYAFLGRLEPIPDNGYRLVVALQSADPAEAAVRVGALAERAGFANPVCIPAADALLCRWLAAVALESATDRTVVAVAVGDTAVQVRAYRTRHPGRIDPEILAAGRPVLIAGTGQAWWQARVLDLVAHNLNAPIPPDLDLAMRDAAAELGAQLGRAEPGQKVAWTGPLARKLLSPLQLTRQTCAVWPEVLGLNMRLAPAISAALAGLGTTDPADRVLLGGVGAAWPFAAAAAGDLVSPGALWQSPDPARDVALGAAWWPLIGEPYAATCEVRGKSDVLKAAAVPALPALSPAAPAPPAPRPRARAESAAAPPTPSAGPASPPAPAAPAAPVAPGAEPAAAPPAPAAKDQERYGAVLPPWERRSTSNE